MVPPSLTYSGQTFHSCNRTNLLATQVFSLEGTTSLIRILERFLGTQVVFCQVGVGRMQPLLTWFTPLARSCKARKRAALTVFARPFHDAK